MIISKLQGGHSNQLFQYAIGKKLAKINRTELLLDVTWFKEFADVDTPRSYELDCYNIATKITDMKNIRVIDPRNIIGQRDKILRKLGIGNTVWTYHEPSMGYNPEALRQPNNTLLIGFWQTEKYFKDIRDELLVELEPTTNMSVKNSKFLNQIKNTTSISLHIRRGDYITNKEANKFHGVMGLDYYKNALEYIVKNLPKKDKANMCLYVFSNDINWCKNNIKFNFPTVFIDSDNTGSEDMRLMKNCQHFVMANSSFSWWGSWLSTNPDKIVVAPKDWFKNKKASGEIDILIDSWKLL